jgi:hypothetical protein
MDGGFEAGTPNPYWGEASTNYGTPLWSLSMGGTGPHSGEWWVWFGGTDELEAGSVAQTIDIAATDGALRLFLEIPVANVDSALEVTVDDVVVFAVTEADQASYATYTEVVVDISAFADGGSHTLAITSWKVAGGLASYFVDDVSISGIAATGVVNGIVRHDGDPLPGVEVWLGGARYQCTAGDGTFSFTDVPTGVSLVAATGPAVSLPCANADFTNSLGQPLAVQAWDHKRANEAWDNFTLSNGEVKLIDFDVVLRQPPVAVADTANVANGGTVDVDVLANDENPEGFAVDIERVTGPSHGTAEWSADKGRFTYVHDGTATTSDSFSYRLDDGVMQSAPATVTITIEPKQVTFVEPTVGLQDPTTGQWHLRDAAGKVTTFYYGNPGDIAFMGDWDCDGVATPGLFRQSDAYAYLRNANTQGIADIRFFFGNPSDVPLAGDFDGDGCDSLSIYRPSEQRFYIMNQLGKNEGGLGAAEYSFIFGNPGDKPVVGDWDGDGIDEVGLHRESTGFFYYRDTLDTGNASGEFYFGDPGDRFVTGDWGVVDGRDTPAVFRPGTTTFYFRHTMTQGVADGSLSWGDGGFVPVAGHFGGLAGGGGIAPPPGIHPTHGDGWRLLQCDTDVETSVYTTADKCARIFVTKFPSPYRSCIYDPFGPPNCIYHDQHRLRWFGPNDQLLGSYEGKFYDPGTGQVAAIWSTTQIAAKGLSPGEYRAELCRTVWPSSTCVEVVLTAHFTISQ